MRILQTGCAKGLTAPEGPRFDRADALRVLRFDTACGCEGCGRRLRRQYDKTVQPPWRAGGKKPPEVANASLWLEWVM